MSDYDLIKEAIQKKRCVTCYYNGYLRKMSPHVIGTKNGNEQALFYQYGGESSSGLSSNTSQNWRCIPVNKIENLSINTDFFQSALNHSKTQTCVSVIDVEIDY